MEEEAAAHPPPSAPPPVRSRWTPKPEQILILESIFNSGMVNPPKEETIRIRKLLEKFGSVGDANVFYWFQNRRSRSRRRQRQIQAARENPENKPAFGGYPPDLLSNYCPVNFGPSSSFRTDADAFHFPDSHGVFPENSSSLRLPQQETMTVFINGVATEVGRGPVDFAAAFGGGLLLVHSSGTAVPVNEYGLLTESLKHGESYFLVPRHE